MAACENCEQAGAAAAVALVAGFATTSDLGHVRPGAAVIGAVLWQYSEVIWSLREAPFKLAHPLFGHCIALPK